MNKLIYVIDNGNIVETLEDAMKFKALGFGYTAKTVEIAGTRSAPIGEWARNQVARVIKLNK